MGNEKGSTLIQVLLVILIFSVLGISLLGNTVGENKRVNKTESDTHARNIARDGLTHFSTSFQRYVEKNSPDSLNLNSFNLFLTEYVNKNDESNGIKITEIKIDDKNPNIVKVASLGSKGSSEKVLNGFYELDFDIDFDRITADLKTFQSGALKDFSNTLVGAKLGGLADLFVLKLPGGNNQYYAVPDSNILSGSLLTLGAGSFDEYKDSEVVAVREGGILGGDLIKGLIKLSLIQIAPEKETNVVINGAYTSLGLLGLKLFGGYKDIKFKKFAVTGSALIEQKDNDRRTFSFDNGLYVGKTLNIGSFNDVSGNEKNSKLNLDGDKNGDGNGGMVAKNLVINNAELSAKSNIYIEGDAVIKNSCINPGDTNLGFRLFVKGKLTIENNSVDSNCNTFNGLFYAEHGIDVITNNKSMIINGGLIGDLTVDGGNDPNNKLTINTKPEFLQQVKVNHIELIPQGRTYE
ncbi:hypothetical protein [Bacillus benzoevorans]